MKKSAAVLITLVLVITAGVFVIPASAVSQPADVSETTEVVLTETSAVSISETVSDELPTGDVLSEPSGALTVAGESANRDSEKQSLSEKFAQKLNRFKEKFYQAFIKENRWQYLIKGLKNTLIITVFAVLIGIFLGFLVASVRYSHDKTERSEMKAFPRFLLNFANAICKVYLTVIRGTPVVVQLMIIYYVIFATVDISKLFVAIIAFGINSGAYVAEIVRSGLTSIDIGQLEAGRSLGLGYTRTMLDIIIPQAFKNILPALGNELIVLLKETSVSGYIALADLTRGGDIIRSITYDAIFPLLAVAAIYLAVVMVLSALVTKLERRLHKSDRR